MRSRRLRKSRHPAAVEINITAFMNLMVILVPFLLMTAVFTHLTILELNLPSPGSSSKDNKKPPFEIQVIIRKNALVLADNRGGLIKRIPTGKTGYNFKTLRQTLKIVKARFPDKTNITILSESDTPYDTLVNVMDSVRSFHVFQDGQLITAELFPDISIGDAPPVK